MKLRSGIYVAINELDYTFRNLCSYIFEYLEWYGARVIRDYHHRNRTVVVIHRYMDDAKCDVWHVT